MFTVSKKLIVLGNGPSLKGIDFHTFRGVDTLGMNAAYRYWQRIGWYPDHYACLDDQLIETHAEAIYDMIMTGKVRSAFLIGKILDFYPDLRERENVFFLESFNAVRQQRVAERGIPFIFSIPFQESDASKVTTGAYAVRYGAHLGYDEISVLGVDLRYVELLPEARQAEGIKLVMAETPQHNPNYFFDDYQQAGDKFNVPNPASHGENLHVAAFRIVANDREQFGWKTRIFNSNPQSVLFDEQIFPFVPARDFLHRRPLGAIVIPTTATELDQLLVNVQIWDQAAFFPLQAALPEENKPDLVFAFSGEEDPASASLLLEAVARTRRLQQCFSRVEVEFIGLDASLDYYQRDYNRAVTGKGFKSGPNEQFFRLMDMHAGVGEFIFYMECDCVPVQAGWLDRIIALAASDHESWLIGSYYRGIAKLDKRFSRHINGNALYRVGSSEFMDFVRAFWHPRLHQVIESVDPRMAYDCLLSYIFTDADPFAANEAWQLLQETGHRFRATALIQNISAAADAAREDIPELVLEIRQRHPETYLLHGHAFLRLVQKHALRQEMQQEDVLSWEKIIEDEVKRRLNPQ
ncbi:hypothetical protein IHQ56_09420 [Methylobacillus flagellatus]|uniref:hypothetical protein n=1 Tax=Methylobacillus flagellatus TaxID=405 RepID=UPI002853BD76|nr:hypothetical protein [Methylobacillus flagellatus]MDR5172036.1 hypothetical protein [Methylobacillus flagellatus]